MIYRKETETMPRSDMAQLQIERLQTTLNRVYRNVAFYQRLFDDRKIDIGRIRTLADVAQLPFTTKEDLRGAYPYGMFAVPLRDIVRVHASSGTTGKAVVVGYTRNDIRHWSELVARVLTGMGVTEHDFVQVALGYGLFTGGLGFHYGAESLGASVIPSSAAARLDEQAFIMRDYKTSVLVSLPSFALALGDSIAGLGISRSELALKCAVLGGESWSETLRRQVEEKLGVKAYDSYGLSEVMGPGVSAECEARDGLHIQEDHFIAEVVDPASGAVLPEGSEGELVFTTITKEGFPLIRFRTGDLATLNTRPCSCGRTLARMSRIAARTDDLIMVQGAKVFPSMIFEAVVSVRGLAPLCTVILDRKDNADTLEVVTAISAEGDFIDEIKAIESIRAKLAARMESTLGVAAKVSFMEEGNLRAQAEGKKQPVVVDKRRK